MYLLSTDTALGLIVQVEDNKWWLSGEDRTYDKHGWGRRNGYPKDQGHEDRSQWTKCENRPLTARTQR